MKITLSLIAVSLMVSSACFAQEPGMSRLAQKLESTQHVNFSPDQVVVKIGKLRINARDSLMLGGLSVSRNGGTGYCLGRKGCEFILTNYHVAERLGEPLKINGVKVLQTFEATGPQDKGAVWAKSPLGFSVKLVPVRDVAILRMQRTLKGKASINFSPHKLYEGEKVRIYGHPGGGRLTVAEAVYFAEAGDGMLFFKVTAGNEAILAPGSSGSLVLDEDNQAVGLMQGFYSGNLAAVVPVWSLAEFVKKALPSKYSDIFSGFHAGEPYRPDNKSLVPVDLVAESSALLKNVGPEAGASPAPILPEEYLWYDLDKTGAALPAQIVGQHSLFRPEESQDVQKLRINSENLLESAKDLIAIGTERSFGGHSPEVSAQYHLRMVSGHQTFTEGDKESNHLPCLKETGIGLGAEWSDLPRMIGNNLKLTIERVDDLHLPEWGVVKVFRYQGTAEDKVAQIQYCTDFGFGVHSETSIDVAVRGEVWTDNALNILRITEELEAPPSRGWLNMRVSQLYGLLEVPEGSNGLVPTNLMVRAEFAHDHQIYSTLCRVTDYHKFIVSTVIGDRAVRPIL